MRIIKGTSPIPIPRTANVPGDIKRLSRETQQSIKALRDREYTVQGNQLSMIAGSRGHFSGYGLRDDDGVWKVKVTPGYLLVINHAVGAFPLDYIMPKIGAVALDAAETPELTVTTGQTVYLKYDSDMHDQPVGSPVIVADDANMEGVHYQPEVEFKGGVNGVNGVYYYKLFDIATAEGGALIISRQWQDGGPIIHRPTLASVGWSGSILINAIHNPPSGPQVTEYLRLVIEDGLVRFVAMDSTDGTTYLSNSAITFFIESSDTDT